MLMLGVPDKYAMERGGWATNTTLKNVYQHTFDEERRKVDEQIDGFSSLCLANELLLRSRCFLYIGRRRFFIDFSILSCYNRDMEKHVAFSCRSENGGVL